MGETQITTNIYETLLFIKLVLLIESTLSYELQITIHPCTSSKS